MLLVLMYINFNFQELFKAIGIKFIDPNSQIEDNMTSDEKEIERVRKQTVKISNNDQKKEIKQKKCC